MIKWINERAVEWVCEDVNELMSRWVIGLETCLN